MTSSRAKHSARPASPIPSPTAEPAIEAAIAPIVTSAIASAMAQVVITMRTIAAMILVALAAWTALAVVLAAPSLAAKPLDFEKIIDTSSPLSTGGVFLHLNSVPALSGEDVAFAGIFATASNESRNGIQARVGGVLLPIADTATTVPGRQAFLIQFGPPSIHAGRIVFTAQDSEGGAGLYAWKTALSVIADSSTPAPGGQTFTDFAFPSVSGAKGEVVAFLGLVDNAASGVYLSDESNGRIGNEHGMKRVVDVFTPVPGGQGNAFVAFTAPSADDHEVAFAAFGRVVNGAFSEPGLYAWKNGRLSELVGPQATIPGKGGCFTEIAAPSLSGGNVAFRGFGPAPEEEGVYLLRGGKLELVANDRTIPPGASLRFRAFGAVSLSGEAYAFTAQDLLAVSSVWSSLGTEPGETMRRVVGQGDIVDGKTVAGAECSNQALDGDRMVVWIEFTDGSQGIYLVRSQPPVTPPIYSVILQAPYDGQTVHASGAPPPFRVVLRDEAGLALTAANLAPAPLLVVAPAGSCADQRLQSRNDYWEYDFSSCRLAAGVHDLALLSGDAKQYVLASPPLPDLDLSSASQSRAVRRPTPAPLLY